MTHNSPKLSIIILFILLLLMIAISGCTSYSVDHGTEAFKSQVKQGYREDLPNEYFVFDQYRNFEDSHPNWDYSGYYYLNGKVVKNLPKTDNINHILVATQPTKIQRFGQPSNPYYRIIEIDGGVVHVNYFSNEVFSSGDRVSGAVYLEKPYSEGIPYIDQKIYPQMTSLGIGKSELEYETFSRQIISMYPNVTVV